MDMADIQKEKSRIGVVILGVGLLLLPIVIFASVNATRTKTLAEETLVGDVNHDGRVSLDDVSMIREAITEQVYNKDADLNGDKKVDEKDIAFFYDILSARK